MLLFKNASTHLNQQLAAPLEHFCAKLLGDCKEFDPDILSCITAVFTRLASKDIRLFMYNFSNI